MASQVKPTPRLRELGVGRRSAADDLFAAGDALCRPYVREGVIDIDDETLCHSVIASFPCEAPGCVEVFDSMLDFELHYKSRHIMICGECRKPLPSAHLLDLHLSEAHDSFFAAQAERKPMFRCFVEECDVLCRDAVERREHCISQHAFPPDFRFDDSRKKKNKTAKNSKATGSSETELMSVDEVTMELNKFTFGHSRKKTFSANYDSEKYKSARRNDGGKNVTLKNSASENQGDGSQLSSNSEHMEF